MKFRILLMIFIITLTIGGCKQAEPQSSVQSETPSASVQAEASPPPVQSEAPPSPAPTVYVDSTKENFHIAIATEELLGKYESYHEYASDELERIIIWTDTIVKDFDFTTVKYDDTGDEFTFSEGDVLFSLDEFTPDKPFVADIFSPEIFPVNGMCMASGGTFSFRRTAGVSRKRRRIISVSLKTRGCF